MRVLLFVELLALLVTSGYAFSCADSGNLYGSVGWTMLFSLSTPVLYKILDYLWDNAEKTSHER